MDKQSLYVALLLSLPVAAISVTITKASIFHPLRNWVAEHSEWVGKLFTCPYCMSHWVSFVLVACYQPRVFQLWWLLDLILSGFAVVAVSALVSGVIVHLVFAESENRRELEQENKELREALERAKQVLSELHNK